MRDPFIIPPAPLPNGPCIDPCQLAAAIDIPWIPILLIVAAFLVFLWRWRLL